ncbi:MAG: hypothetical protein ACR2LQ_03335 [Acidimicrobiales bacterium]
MNESLNHARWQRRSSPHSKAASWLSRVAKDAAAMETLGRLMVSLVETAIGR